MAGGAGLLIATLAICAQRVDFGAALRRTIAETVGEPGEVDEELKYLLDVVSRPGR
jgi:hypothetical protein